MAHSRHSHRPALEVFHNVKLALDGKGGYTLEPIELDLSASHSNLTLLATERHVVASSKAPPADIEAAYTALSLTEDKTASSFGARITRFMKVLVPSLFDSSSVRLVCCIVEFIDVIHCNRQCWRAW